MRTSDALGAYATQLEGDGRSIHTVKQARRFVRLFVAAMGDPLVATLDMATTTAEKRDRAMFRTMLGLGLRVGSVVALDVEDLDLDAASLAVRTLKNSDSDTVYLPADLVALLRSYVGDRKGGPLF